MQMLEIGMIAERVRRASTTWISRIRRASRQTGKLEDAELQFFQELTGVHCEPMVVLSRD